MLDSIYSTYILCNIYINKKNLEVKNMAGEKQNWAFGGEVVNAPTFKGREIKYNLTPEKMKWLEDRCKKMKGKAIAVTLEELSKFLECNKEKITNIGVTLWTVNAKLRNNRITVRAKKRENGDKANIVAKFTYFEWPPQKKSTTKATTTTTAVSN